MTYEERIAEIINTTTNLKALRAATEVDEVLKLSAVEAGELYLQTLKRVDLGRIRTLPEMIELNELLSELRANYKSRLKELKIKNLLFS